MESIVRSGLTDGRALTTVEEVLMRFSNKVDDKEEVNFTEYTEEQLEKEKNRIRRSFQSGRFRGRYNTKNRSNIRGRERSRNCFT